MYKNKVEHTTIRKEKLFFFHCDGDFFLGSPTWKEPITDQSKDVEQKALWWIANGQVGLSSKTMWQHFMDQPIVRLNHPHDPDDFSRCYKLLEAVPEWKPRILELSVRSKSWKNLAENWNKLTKMFEENERNDWKTSKEIGMHDFMKTLI